MPESIQRDEVGPRSARSGPTLASLVLASLLLLTHGVPVALAANVLSNGTASPGSGTTLTSFTFSVDYTSSAPARAPSVVWANVAGTTVALSLASGSPTNGTWSGFSTLPIGSWPVTFEADVSTGDPDPVGGPTLVVTAPPTPPPPTPTPTPAPPTPTPRPTPPPTPTPAPTPTLPPGATPRPTPTPAPTPTLPPGETPTPTPGAESPSVSPGTSGGSGPGETADPSTTSRTPEASPDSSPDPEPAEVDVVRFDSGPWLVLGGGMSAIGAGVIAVHFLGLWRRQRPLP